MEYFQRQHVERFFAALPGWMFLLSGLTLLGFAVLTPAWLDCREMEHQRDIIKLQAQRIGEQAQAYQSFETALKNDDPVLLERLAFYHLRLKPVGASTLIGPAGINAPARARPLLVSNRQGPPPVPYGDPAAAEVARKLSQSLVSVEAWLQKPMPREGVDYQPLPPVKSRLINLASGKQRTLLLVAAVVLLTLGLLPTGEIGGEPTVRVPFTNRL